jgi:hypothetical protein
MSPVEIDPATGAPIVKATGSVESLPPTSGVTNGAETGSETTETETKEVSEVTSEVPLTRDGFLAQVEDILKRYTSDSQACQKALAEVTALVPK